MNTLYRPLCVKKFHHKTSREKAEKNNFAAEHQQQNYTESTRNNSVLEDIGVKIITQDELNCKENYTRG